MELRYPILAIFLVIIISCYFVFVKQKKAKYTVGSKIANTDYLKNTDYYRKKVKEYKIIKVIFNLLFITGIVASIVLLARLSKTDVSNNNQYNRDIFLCMDISSSVDQLNLELVNNFKKTIGQLHGERFGISIFNTSSVMLVPLTDDYDYVTNVLNDLADAINTKNSIDYDNNDSSFDIYSATNYLYSGTLEGNMIRGSSLIGDGLASCIYSFPNLEEDRSRIVLLSTDNEVLGTPLVTLDEAAKIGKSKNVKVFGIGTSNIKPSDEMAFEKAVQQTGGKYYKNSRQTVSNIVSDIENTSKSLLKQKIEKRVIDIPQIPFVILFVSIIGTIIVSKKVLK